MLSKSALFQGISSIALLTVVAGGCASRDDYSPPATNSMSIPPSLLKADFESGGENEWPRSKNGKGITVNHTTVFDYEDTMEYQVNVCSNGKLTNFVLAPGERSTGKEMVVFGDAKGARDNRWLITGKVAGNRQVISLTAKRPRQTSDMFISTDKRMYTFSLYSSKNCMKIVKFDYPPVRNAKSVSSESYDASKVSNNYSVSLVDGKTPAWFPVNVFDMGGQKTWIEFSRPVGHVGAPGVLVGDGDKKVSAQKRTIDGRFYEVLNMGNSADLVLGETRVRIEKGD